jgi:hypothetical protein
VIGIDHIEGLKELSKTNLRKDRKNVGAGSGEIEIVMGDGRKGESLLCVAFDYRPETKAYV